MNEEPTIVSTIVEIISDDPAAVETEGIDPASTDATVPETTQAAEPDATAEASEEVTEETSSESTAATDPPAAPTTQPDELDGTEYTIYEDLSGSEETTEATEEVVIVEVIESVGSDIAHASLFSGFLVCGTLVGLALLRKIYGT